MERQEDIGVFSSKQFVHIEPKEWLKPGADLVQLPPKFKIYSLSLKEWLFFQRRPVHVEYSQVPRGELKNFPPNPGTYELADSQNPVAVIVPAQNAEIQARSVHCGAGISGPCMTPRGVELVIANTVYNPNIRWIILAGNDSGHLTGDMIDCIVQNGIDENGRVIGAKSPTYPYLKNLPKDVISRFREQITVVDLLKCKDTDVIGFVVRMCLQEDANAFEMSAKKRKYLLYDAGAVSKSPMLFDFSVMRLGAVFDNYNAFAGASIHAININEAFKSIQGHLLNCGSWGKQESSRMALECTNVSITVHDVSHDAVPKDYRPQSWLETDADTKDYLEKYANWVYLFPISDVGCDASIKKTVPKLVENLEYTYGTRLTAYGFESCRDKYELSAIRDFTQQWQKKFYNKIPAFSDVLSFYDKMAAVQDKTFNSLYSLAKGCATIVSDNIGNSCRMYATLQIPNIDIAKSSPYDMHAPCFCHYQPNPRFARYGISESGGVEYKTFIPSIPGNSGALEKKFSEIKSGWFLFPLFSMRAHDAMAFPCNAAGGIVISNFIARYIEKCSGKQVEIGNYTQFASALHILDYALDKKIIEMLNKSF